MSDLGLSDYPLNLKAGKWQKLAVPGDYIQVVQGTGWVQIRPDSGSVISRRPSSGQPLVAYRYVEFMSVADQFVVVSLGFTGGGQPFDSGAVFAGTVNVLANVPNLRVSPADVSIPAGATVQVALDDATRILLSVQLDDGAPNAVRVGDANVDGTHGVKIQPDDIALPEGRAPVYVFNPGAVAVTVHLDAEFLA